MWGQIIGAAIGAYGNYKANRRNEQRADYLFERDTAAVTPKPFTSGIGYSSYTPEGGTVIGLSDKYQAEADWALEDAARNKGWLSQYQQGGPTAAADVLYEQRAAPLRRQQERERQLFEERATARGMLQSTSTDRAAGLQTEAWGNVYGDVYNKSFMDVQGIIDRYRDRISGSITAAGSIYDKPLEYATKLGMPQGEVYSPTAVQGIEALSGAGTTGSATYGNFFKGLGTDIQEEKYSINGNNKGNNLAAPPGMKQYKPSGTYQSSLFRPSAEVNYYGL